MPRTRIKLCLTLALALSGTLALAEPPRADAPKAAAAVERVQLLKTKLQRLTLDPAALIAGAVRCACLHDLLYPVEAAALRHYPIRGAARAVGRDGSPVTVGPTLLDDRLGLQIHVQW